MIAERHTQGWFVANRKMNSLYRHARDAFRRGDERMGRYWTAQADSMKAARDRCA